MKFFNRSLDVDLLFEDGAAAFTASGWGSETIDFGGFGGHAYNTLVPRMLCAVQILIESEADMVTTESGSIDDHRYAIWVCGSNDAALGDTSPSVTDMVTLGCLELGNADAPFLCSATGLADRTGAGRYVMPIVNCTYDTEYRYIRLWVDVSSLTSNANPSIQFKAYLTLKDQ